MSVHASTYMPSPRGGLPHSYTNGYSAGPGSGYANGYAGHVNGYAPGSGMAPPQSARVAAPAVQGFAFRSRQERIDWKKIASIDVERVMRELDVNSLQESMIGVTFCDIEREIDTRMVDQNFVTVFKLAQLIIQYLLHSQEVMAHNTSVAEERVGMLHADHEVTKQEMGRLRAELEKVRQESHKRKKQLKNQQSLIQATANNYHKCMYCDKAFMNLAYLQSHTQRKHPEFTPRPAGQPAPEDNVNLKRMSELNERLEREMEELRNRLKLSESQLEEQRYKTEEQVRMALQQHQHSQVDVERQEEQHRKELERWKTEQLELQKMEMEKMQNMFMKEMKEMHDKYATSQAAMENIQANIGKQSMLGKVVDEDELEEYKKKSEKQKKEINKLREQIQSEMAAMESKVTEDMQRQEEKWKEKQKAARSHHREEVKELKGLLEHTKQLLNIERQGGDKKGAKYERQMQELLKKNQEYEKQIKLKEDKIKDLKVKASKHYEVVEPRSSPPPRMTINNNMEPPSDEDEDDTDLEDGMDTLSRVLQESESWLTGTHPSYNLPDSDIEEDELDGAPMYDQPRSQLTFEQNKERIVSGLKDQLAGVLQKSLAKRGVPEGMRGISTHSLENKIKILKNERQQLATKHSQFYDIRERFKHAVDRKAAELRKSGGKPADTSPHAGSPQQKKKAQTSQKHATSSKGKEKMRQPQQQVKHRQQQPAKQRQQQPVQQKQQKPHQQQQQPQRRQQQQQQNSGYQKPAIKNLSPGQVKAPPPVAQRSPDVNRRGPGKAGQANKRRPASRVSFEDESEDEDEEESEEEESESFDDEDDDEEEEDHYQRPMVPPRPAAHSQPATNGFHKGTTEGQASDEDSEWDSEEISDLEEAAARPTSTNNAVKPVRQPQGSMVSSLTRSIEMQLSGRRQGQKPVGGVDLGGSSGARPPHPAPRTPSPSPTPRIPTIPDARGGDDDDDDSGSISVSSLGDSFSGHSPEKATSPTPAPRMGSGRRTGNDTELSSNTYTGMWGSSKGRGTGTGKSSLVSVTDFDDDDDLGIDDL